VELRRFEPLTFCMLCSLVSSDGVALGLVTALQSGISVWGRLARSGGIWVRWSLNWSWMPDLPVKGRWIIIIRITGDTKALEAGIASWPLCGSASTPRPMAPVHVSLVDCFVAGRS
jgi:hypothetical protein